MKCKIPEISWHNRDPVLSVDIQPKIDKSIVYRLASGGTDSHVLIWSLLFTETGEVNLDVVADLTRHQRAVNVVKWSPNGQLLASGDDESFVFIWKQKEESEPINILDTTNEHDKETWITLKVLRGHMEDIYDLSWAPNSQFLVSGSVDNTAIIWDIQKGKSISILNDHKGFVQGVAWDPNNQYIATLSTDRFLRIFDIQTKKVVHRVSKTLLPALKDEDLVGKKIRLYHDDTLQTFFRRLCFSPDGKLLLTPAGVIDCDGVSHITHTTYIYSRYSLKQPSIILPSADQYTVAVKCCPVLFELRSKTDVSTAAVPLPYRMVFAVATKSSVYLYDTQQTMPFGVISNIHYTRLTDITWSNDGRIMIVSSTDGFCSLITFDEGELGEEYVETPCLKENKNIENKKSIKSPDKVDYKKEIPKENVGCSIVKFPREITIDKDIISSDKKFESPEEISRPATASKKRILENIKSPDKVDGKKEIPEENTGCSIAKFPGEIILDKDIISSDKKFDSQEKISRPATASVKSILENFKSPDGNKKIPEENAGCSIAKFPREIIIDKDIISSDMKFESQDEISQPATASLKSILDNFKSPDGNKKIPEENAGCSNANFPGGIIVDKVIISSDEKFESPGKICRPATPISVHRQPRTPVNKSKSSISSRSKVNFTPHQIKKKQSPTSDKKKTSILSFFKRKNDDKSDVTSGCIEVIDLVDEDTEDGKMPEHAVEKLNCDQADICNSSKSTNVQGTPEHEITIEVTSGCTDVINLLDEDTEDAKRPDHAAEKLNCNRADKCDSSKSINVQGTPENKMPRRVQLKTISTPKSKKKLLE